MKTVRMVKELSAILFIDQKTQPRGGRAFPMSKRESFLYLCGCAERGFTDGNT